MEKIPQKTLSHLPQRPAYNIDFQDLSYSVPNGRKGTKLILRSVSGSFRSGHLTAILGPSGAGKSTLLNILAGYKSRQATGLVAVNGEPRNMSEFRKQSRYIMQQDLLQPLLTVQECMMIASELKLSRELSRGNKLIAISEILDLLHLSQAKDTTTDRLSGGERKRLSIALELINNPPVIFLDEPTTGLDDVSCYQCISLLKLLAAGGRTVICSIHSPSSRLFSVFDHVYIVAAGLCAYQGTGSNIVPFVQQIGLTCPLIYNPADFILEVTSGEYGNQTEKLVSLIENGKNSWECKEDAKQCSINSFISPLHQNSVAHAPTTTSKKFIPKYDSSMWVQFKTLIYMMLLQTFRNTKYLAMKVGLYIFLGTIIGGLFLDFGHDGSKTIFNFGFCFTCIIVFMYCPLLPVLLNFPLEVQLLKREHFNRWYGLPSYFLAITTISIPFHIVLTSLYVSIVYFLTDQPLELHRIAMFLVICILIGFISESIGLVISSTLNILNGLFLGITLTVPLMLLAVHGVGEEKEDIPILIRIGMYSDYLRYGLEGLAVAIYDDRGLLPCPEDDNICYFMNPARLMKEVGMVNLNFSFDIAMLCVMLVIIKGLSYYLLQQRLSPNKTFQYLHVIGRIVKSHIGPIDNC